MNILRTRFLLFILVNGLFLLSGGLNPACAVKPEPNEIESITVLADSSLALPLAELASQYAHQSTVSVGVAFGPSGDQQKKIEAGEPADLFITADKERIEHLKANGMIDVYSITTLTSEGSAHYVAAVVASENMTPARAFLNYLKSNEAKAVFKRDNLTH